MPDIRKIVIIGPESTGKSTLSKALGAALHTAVVREYAREYLEQLGRPYTEQDLQTIAAGQLAAEDRLQAMARRYLICDTDLYVIKVWSEARYGRCHPDILAGIACRRYDLYLLTYTDIAWADDPLREHPAPDDRYYFYQQYRDIVLNSGIPWADIRGNEQERLQQSLHAIDRLVS